MLGTVRFALAATVLMNHLWDVVANQVGATAVIGFYTVSGFLMTKVITEVYADGPRGAFAFAVNRVLRIYPGYLLVVALSTIFFVQFEGLFDNFYPTMQPPETARAWLSNLTLYSVIDQPRVIVPAAWSLAVELLFYALMVVGLSRSRLIVWIWFATSLAWTIYLNANGSNFAQRYYPADAASLWFAIGALLYVEPWLRQALAVPERVALILLPIVCLLPAGVRALGLDPFTLGYYGGYGLLLPVLATALSSTARKSDGLDATLGDLAYPVFLGHFMIGALIHVVAGIWLKAYSTPFAIASLIGTVVFAWIYVQSVDRRLQAWRAAIRPRNATVQSKRATKAHA